MRLSLAGAQRKLPVILNNNRLCLPQNHLSTHIVKPRSERFAELVENEYLCMSTAQGVGLNVPDVTLLPYINENREELDCYVVQRYDRENHKDKTIRIHQEDLCQILGIASSHKYVGDGGPGYRELFETTRKYTRPSAIHQNELVRRILFNLVIGNHVAHGKNFSFLHSNNTLALAPAYDLVCTAIYPELSQEFSMPFGGARNMAALNSDALTQFSEQTGIHLRRQARELTRFLDMILTTFTREAEILENHSYPAIGRLIERMYHVIKNNHACVRDLFLF